MARVVRVVEIWKCRECGAKQQIVVVGGVEAPCETKDGRVITTISAADARTAGWKRTEAGELCPACAKDAGS